MADPRAFISFDFDHNSTEKVLFIGQARNSKTPFSIEDWSSKSHLPQAQWETLLEARSTVAICSSCSLEGTWQALRELQRRSAWRWIRTYQCVYVGGADSLSILPAGLRRNRTITWSWDLIADAIDQMMTEGRNE